jgi:hypothetical protein
VKILAALKRYAAADDPMVATANWVAMVLAWNTPFYPLYLRGAAGAAIWPGGWLTLCVFPVFLAVPAICRRDPLAGRVLLALAATGNTIYCTWLLGEASGTQLFLLPCITLASLLFRRDELPMLGGFLLMPIAAGLLLDGRYPVSPFVCAGAACGGILWMNAFSVALLMAFLGWLASGLVTSPRAGATRTPR